MRPCPQCERWLEIDQFAPDATKANGRKSACRACDNAKSRRYYKANRGRVLARVAAYQGRRRESEKGA